MRKLNTSDLFAAMRMIKKCKLKDTIKETILTIDKKQDVEATGFDLIFGIIEAMCEENCEKEFYNFLSKPFEISPQEVEKLDIDKLINGIKEIADLESWKSFFMQALK